MCFNLFVTIFLYLYLIRLLYYYMKLDYIFAWVGECIHFVLCPSTTSLLD